MSIAAAASGVVTWPGQDREERTRVVWDPRPQMTLSQPTCVQLSDKGPNVSWLRAAPPLRQSQVLHDVQPPNVLRLCFHLSLKLRFCDVLCGLLEFRCMESLRHLSDFNFLCDSAPCSAIGSRKLELQGVLARMGRLLLTFLKCASWQGLRAATGRARPPGLWGLIW